MAPIDAFERPSRPGGRSNNVRPRDLPRDRQAHSAATVTSLAFTDPSFAEGAAASFRRSERAESARMSSELRIRQKWAEGLRRGPGRQEAEFRFWEKTGNFADSALGRAWEAAKTGTKSVSYGPIPYAS